MMGRTWVTGASVLQTDEKRPVCQELYSKHQSPAPENGFQKREKGKKGVRVEREREKMSQKAN